MEFKKYTVEELVKLNMLEKPMDGNHGSKHPTSKDYVKEGIPFVMVSDINNGKINYKTCKFISEKTRNNLDKGFAKPKDVLLSHKATIGLTAVVGDEYEEIVLTPQLTYYRVKNNINNKYLKYYFDSPYFQNILKSWSTSGSTRAYLGITAQLKLPILLPNINNQNKIANILSTIDRKIGLNNQINNNLYEIIKVQYNNFMSKLTEYNFAKLKDIASISSGKRPKNKGKKYRIPLVGASGIMSYTDDYNSDSDILVIGRVGTLGVVQRYFDKVWLSDNVISIKTEYMNVLENFLRYVDYQSLNRGSTQPLITQTDINNLEIKFNKNEFISFEKQTKELRNKIALNNEQSKVLKKLRDTLLPNLMNGEINLDKIKC